MGDVRVMERSFDGGIELRYSISMGLEEFL